MATWTGGLIFISAELGLVLDACRALGDTWGLTYGKIGYAVQESAQRRCSACGILNLFSGNLKTSSCLWPRWTVGLDLVARRVITPGEQITIDYATCCVENLAEFPCRCVFVSSERCDLLSFGDISWLAVYMACSEQRWAIQDKWDLATNLVNANHNIDLQFPASGFSTKHWRDLRGTKEQNRPCVVLGSGNLWGPSQVCVKGQLAGQLADGVFQTALEELVDRFLVFFNKPSCGPTSTPLR